jgi:hypothetical protein
MAAQAQTPIDLCFTSSGGGVTRQIDFGLTSYVLNSATSPFAFYGNASGETSDLQPVMGTAILRHGGINLYFGIEGFPTQDHPYTLEEGGSVSIFTFSGVGRRVERSDTGATTSTPTTVQLTLGACS